MRETLLEIIKSNSRSC